MTNRKSSLWKPLRIIILLLILFIVVVNAWKDKNQNWDQSIFIAVYPINADHQHTTQRYISNLQEADFQPIAVYLQQQAETYQQPIYIYFRLGQQVSILPPQVPESSSVLGVMLWSLKFRYYAWRQQQAFDITPDLTLYLNFYDPDRVKMLKHSTALENGRIGIVNLFASPKQNEQNQIVMAHEILHAFGATDKYDLSTGRPIYPQGYVNPNQSSRYPQTQAELMAGHIAVSESQSKMPASLKQVVINQQTAQEIGWIK